MANIFFMADPHFGHAKILTFRRRDGVTPLRDFPSIEAHDNYIIDRINSVVQPGDHLYMLGDIVIKKAYLHLLDRINTRKLRLVLGNHDIFGFENYAAAGFQKITAFRKFDGIMCTHVPVHEDSLGRWGVNVHGHLHGDYVKIMHNGKRTDKPDTRYFCVSMEHLDDYTPISLEEIHAKIGYRK